MKVLVVKLSSLGDVVHAFPAFCDAAAARPDVELHWLVDEAFAPIARLQRGIATVLAVPLRQWKRRPHAHVGDLLALRRRLRGGGYAQVLDAQGLVKSAVVARLAAAPVAGFDRDSAREAVAVAAYAKRVSVARDAHALDRLRTLFARTLGYPVPATPPKFGLVRPAPGNALLFMHGTSWDSKAWPERAWRELAERAVGAGHPVVLPWGDARERARAERIATGLRGVRVAAPQPLETLVGEIAAARGVVTVDSGLGHLAAAYGVPTVGLFGPTDPARTGCRGPGAVDLAATFACAPCRRRTCGYRGPPIEHEGLAVVPACWSTVTPRAVWQALEARL